jgi:hypothetical protein
MKKPAAKGGRAAPANSITYPKSSCTAALWPERGSTSSSTSWRQREEEIGIIHRLDGCERRSEGDRLVREQGVTVEPIEKNVIE